MKWFSSIWHRADGPSAAPTPVPYPEKSLPEPKKVKRNKAPEFEEFRTEAIPPGVYEELPDSLRAMKHYKAVRKRWLHPSQIAEGFVAYLREEGLCDYPHLCDDLDESMLYWMDRNNIEPVSPKVVKEDLVLLAGCYRTRERLKDYNPKHRYVMQRLRTLQSTNDRPVLYYVSPTAPIEAVPDVPDLSWPEPPAQAQERVPGATKRKRKGRAGRPAGGQQPSSPQPMYEGVEIDWEPPSRRVA